MEEKRFFSLRGSYRKFLVVLVILLSFFLLGVVPGIGYFNLSNQTTLPAWQVQNPVSKVFVLESIPPTTGSLAAGDSTVPNEYLIDPAIDTLLLLLETEGIYLHRTISQPTGLVGADNIVIIKGNFQWTGRNTTNTDRIKGLIWQILQHPDGFTGEIVVCDNTQIIGTGIDHNDNNSDDLQQSIMDVVSTFKSKGYPVYLRDWLDIWDAVVDEYSYGDTLEGFVYDPLTKISYPKFNSPTGNFQISLKHGIWNKDSLLYDPDRLCLINFPVLKAHSMSGATIALKNWIGVLTTAYEDERYGGHESMHYNYFFGSFALVAKIVGAVFPDLTIVDAAWTNAKANAGNTDLVNTKMLAASTDPCAASWYAAKFILTPIAITPIHTNPDYVGGKYRNNLVAWTDCLKDSGFAVTIDSAEISVYNLATIPVELTSFTAEYINNEVQLSWTTASETNNLGFEIEKGTNKTNFKKIGFSKGAGTTLETKFYSFTDSLMTGTKQYYRLKQLNLDGSYKYSKIAEINLERPSEFALYQNYPNPFNPVTTISYQIPKECHVKLTVYDILGNIVVSLINKEQDSGFYSVKFNSQNLSSGIYFYRLETDSFFDTKQMIVLK
ncbi:MAG: DUF362 domain-containing protein [Ignavibacterium sp.]|nr:DUF362 domain-containing protein [Ignavibacterium sp.]